MPSGPRIRANNVYGVTTDNPLTIGATSYNSPGLALLPVVASAHAVVTLDPLRQFGEPEIVIVTAHTAAATVATITRGAYGTTPRAHPVNTVWVHAPLDEDVTEILTSSTRPSDPYRGQDIFETDTNRYVSRSTADVWQQKGLFFDPPACRVFHNTTQSIADITLTPVIFNSERYDTDSMHSTVSLTNRIVINTAGLYMVTFNGFFVGNDYIRVYAELRANGTTTIAAIQEDTNANNDGKSLLLATVYKFAVGEYIEAYVFHDNTANVARNLSSAGNYSPELSATWIGRGN